MDQGRLMRAGVGRASWVPQNKTLLYWGGIGLVYAGLKFPGHKKVLNLVAEAIDRPDYTAQFVSLSAGALMILAAKGD